MKYIFHYSAYATCKMYITLSVQKNSNSYILCFTFNVCSRCLLMRLSNWIMYDNSVHSTLQLDFVIMKTTDLINMKMWQTILLSQQTMLKLYLPTNEDGAVICNKRVIFTETLNQIQQNCKPCYFAKCSGTRVCSSPRHPLSTTERVQTTGSYRGSYA